MRVALFVTCVNDAHLRRRRGRRGRLVPRTYELTEFLVDVLAVSDVGAYFPHTVTYHPSCHGLRMLRPGERPRRLLESAPSPSPPPSAAPATTSAPSPSTSPRSWSTCASRSPTGAAPATAWRERRSGLPAGVLDHPAVLATVQRSLSRTRKLHPKKLPGPGAGGWTDSRGPPRPPPEPFRDRWAESHAPGDR